MNGKQKWEVVAIKRKIEAFIFDLDGVLTDTAEFHFRSWKRLCNEESIPFNREINEKLRGVSRRKSLEIILGDREVSQEKFVKMMERKNHYYRESIQSISQVDLFPGAEKILQNLREKDIKLALGSSSKNACLVIHGLGIKNYFEVIADGNSVERAKPAPDLFLYAAEKMEVSPEKCVVVEDAEAGIEAALEAGMFVVGIGPPERVEQSHFHFSNVSEINLKKILNQ